MERVAIYPGSFDPVTNGHLDILERGLKLFDKIILAILTNPKKNFLFTLEQIVLFVEMILGSQIEDGMEFIPFGAVNV